MQGSDGGWDLSPELKALRVSISSFMGKEVRPLEETLDHDAYEIPAAALLPLQAKARRSGLWGLYSPAEYGGAGLSLLGQAVAAEESAKCRMGAYVPAGAAFGWDPPNIIFDGSPDQIEHYGRPAVQSGEKTFVAVTEPSGGSDPGRSIETTATPDGDGWVLNGTKLWISGADTSRWGIVFARTGSRTGPISCFIIETDSPGFSASPVPVMRSWYPCEVRLENCLVPGGNLLGEEGQGFQTAQRWLRAARVTYAAATIGVAQAALDIGVEYAKQRRAFGSLLAAKQAVQWMIADSEVELRAARLLVWNAAARGDLGEDYKVDASVAKLFATETACRVVDRCIQILGGMGVSQEMPLERWYRELRIKRIGEGPSEVHRMVVARDLLGTAMRA